MAAAEWPRIARASAEFKRVRSLRRSAGRRAERAAIGEGRHFLDACLDPESSDSVRPRVAVFGDGFLAGLEASERAALVDRLDALGVPVRIASDRDIALLSDTSTPQGVVVVVSTPEPVMGPGPARRVLVTDRIADPGNLGTLIRSAAAFGFSEVAVIGGADPFGPKLLRSTVGAGGRVRVAVAGSGPAYLDACLAGGFSVVAAVSRGGDDPEALAVDEPVALVVGSESHGVSREVLDRVAGQLTLPSTDAVESLNAAVAGSIAMYAVSRELAKRGETP